jgi:hypothetical protein
MKLSKKEKGNRKKCNGFFLRAQLFWLRFLKSQSIWLNPQSAIAEAKKAVDHFVSAIFSKSVDRIG